MSKYISVTAIVSGLIAAALFMFAYNKIAVVRKVTGGQ